jgi:ABC-type branched-subunit amino acid transport system substrate-binding protein
VLCGNSGSYQNVVKNLKNDNLAFYGYASLLHNANSSNPLLSSIGDCRIVTPDIWHSKKGMEFQKSFKLKYRSSAGIVGANAYEGTKLLTEIIVKTGLNKSELRDALANTVYDDQLTGDLKFDKFGNRLDQFRLLHFRYGQPMMDK